MRDNYPLHIVLFLLTLATTCMAGAELVTGKAYIFPLLSGGLPPEALLTWRELGSGLAYSLSFLAFLTAHEFGHYLTAVYHKVRCSLPYYIPIFLPFGGFMNIGSFGAVIRLREVPATTRKYFDIAVMGPLAGLVVSIGILILGFATLPPAEDYIYKVHEDYDSRFGHVPSVQELQNAKTVDYQGNEVSSYPVILQVGSNLLFEILKAVIPSDPSRVPPTHELMHYPFLFVGFLTLFFTAMNLLPIGQLDGGHVVYGLFGRKAAGYISRGAAFCLLVLGGTGVMAWRPYSPEEYGFVYNYILSNVAGILVYGFVAWRIISAILNQYSRRTHLIVTTVVLAAQSGACFLLPDLEMNPIWLIYGFMATSMMGLDHPEAKLEMPLTPLQKALGWLAVLVFILCFTPFPLRLAVAV